MRPTLGEWIIRDIDDDVLDRINQKTEDERRSLERQLREVILSVAQQLSVKESVEQLNELRQRFAGRVFSDSAELISEDRDR